jgi:hypothetical protein
VEVEVASVPVQELRVDLAAVADKPVVQVVRVLLDHQGKVMTVALGILPVVRLWAVAVAALVKQVPLALLQKAEMAATALYLLLEIHQ